MLGRFSSAEVCCLNPAEGAREKERRGRKQEGEAANPDNGDSEEEKGVFSRIRLFLKVSRALCFRLMVMDGPPL